MYNLAILLVVDLAAVPCPILLVLTKVVNIEFDDPPRSLCHSIEDFLDIQFIKNTSNLTSFAVIGIYSFKLVLYQVFVSFSHMFISQEK